MAWTATDWLWNGPKAVSEPLDGDANDTIARIIGARAWGTLPQAVRARFERMTPAAYSGRTQTRHNLIGFVFAWALFPFGAPIPVLAGAQNAMVLVKVKDGGMSWTRIYRGPLGLAFQVHSIKRPSSDGRLFECCAGGWTMLLDVFADHGSLVFRSCSFFWRFGPVSIPLPLLLTPGIAEVRHTDLGGGQFRFTLTFDHPWFGRTIFQDGVFADPQE